MDGVGGVLKRSADRCVLHGEDITSASSFVEKVKEVSVELWEVPQHEIHEMKKKTTKDDTSDSKNNVRTSINMVQKEIIEYIP